MHDTLKTKLCIAKYVQKMYFSLMHYLSPAACGAVLEQAAEFFDRHRKLGCDYLAVTLPHSSQYPTLELHIVAPHDQYSHYAEGGAPPIIFSEADLVWQAVRADSLEMDRPHAGFAIRALRTFVEELPVDVKEARGFRLDGWSPNMPQLELDCPVNPKTIDQMQTFLKGKKVAYNSMGIPYVATDYLNYTGQPINVCLNLRPLV